MDPVPQATRQKASPSLTTRSICWVSKQLWVLSKLQPCQEEELEPFPGLKVPFLFGQQGWKGVLMSTLDYGDLLICVATCWPRWCSQQLRRDPSLATRTCIVIESIQEEGQLDLSWSIYAYCVSTVHHHVHVFSPGRNPRGCRSMILNALFRLRSNIEASHWPTWSPHLSIFVYFTCRKQTLQWMQGEMLHSWHDYITDHEAPFVSPIITAFLASFCWVELSGRPRGRVIYGGSSRDDGKDTCLTGCRSSSGNVDAGQCMWMNKPQWKAVCFDNVFFRMTWCAPFSQMKIVIKHNINHKYHHWHIMTWFVIFGTCFFAHTVR